MKSHSPSGALSRVAWVFGVPADTLTPEKAFGTDLRVNFVAQGVDNELDEILYDVQEMRKGLSRHDPASGEVHTVGDFCALAQRLESANPTAWHRLQKRWNEEANAKDRQAGMRSRPLWRRLIYWLTRL